MQPLDAHYTEASSLSVLCSCKPSVCSGVPSLTGYFVGSAGYIPCGSHRSFSVLGLTAFIFDFPVILN